LGAESKNSSAAAAIKAEQAKEVKADFKSSEESTTESVLENARPFQTLEFLVRDWQNFVDEEDSETMLEYNLA
jgi:hypothetical protein